MEPIVQHSNDDRVVDLSDEDPVLPESTLDDTDAGWGEPPRRHGDDFWHDERPPHWD